MGDGDEAGWRAAGAAVVRPARTTSRSRSRCPATSRRPRCAASPRGSGSAATATATPARNAGPARCESGHRPRDVRDGLAQAQRRQRATWLARDLTNAPASIKNPDWFAEEVVGAAAKRPGLRSPSGPATTWRASAACGRSAAAPGSTPCLVEMSWRPAGARTHVVLVGKGITFDTGGISIKTAAGHEADEDRHGRRGGRHRGHARRGRLGLPVRITALAPLAENAVSGVGVPARRRASPTTTARPASRPTRDAEGRLVLADALGYAVAELDADVIIDLATLTGAQVGRAGQAHRRALQRQRRPGRRADRRPAPAAGERMWRMPLLDDYRDYLRSDIADRHSSPAEGGGRGRAVPARVPRRPGRPLGAPRHGRPGLGRDADLELTKGATGWRCTSMTVTASSTPTSRRPLRVSGPVPKAGTTSATLPRGHRAEDQPDP